MSKKKQQLKEKYEHKKSIIDELEKWLKEEIKECEAEQAKEWDYEEIYQIIGYITSYRGCLTKLQDLKGESNDTNK